MVMEALVLKGGGEVDVRTPAPAANKLTNVQDVATTRGLLAQTYHTRLESCLGAARPKGQCSGLS